MFTYFIHINIKRCFYVDFDENKEFNFEILIYYVKEF